MKKHWGMLLLALSWTSGCHRGPRTDETRVTQEQRTQLVASGGVASRRSLGAPTTNSAPAPADTGADVDATELFGTALITATREQLKQAISSKGASLTRTSSHFDVYDSRKLLDESKDLRLGFTSDGRFARAIYTLPSFMDADQVARVADLVTRKYDAPTRAQGRVDLGEVRFEWTRSDGVRIVVHRGWPSTTTYLEYHHPQNSVRLGHEQEQNRDQHERQDFARQKDAL